MNSVDWLLDTGIGYLSKQLAKGTFEEIDMKMNLDTKPDKLFHQVFSAIQIDMMSVLRKPRISIHHLISSGDVFLTSTNAELK